MDINNKFKIKTAKPAAVNQFNNLSCDHITTSNFMELQPVYYRHLTPADETLTVTAEAFSRLQPMPVPTMGRAQQNIRGFWVPYRTLMSSWNTFITDTYEGLQTRLPMVTSSAFTMLFLSEDMSTTTNENKFDFLYNTGTTSKYYKFTPFGRKVYKIILSLGYDYTIGDLGDITYNALALLAYFKVINDWYYPSQYVADSFLSSLLSNIYRGGFSSLSASQLHEAFKYAAAVDMYNPDYFTSAFDNPEGPSVVANTSIIFNDISSGGLPVQLTSQGNTPYIEIGEGSSTGEGLVTLPKLTEYGLHTLHTLSDYMKRHQLAGSRALDRYLARFGVTLSTEKLNRSTYIGVKSTPLQFSSVESNSSTEGATLGDYAGKGQSFIQDSFTCNPQNEYGMFLIINSFVPQVGYVQGIDRHNLHLSNYDFYNPEFDALGNQAISKLELYNNIVRYVDNSEDVVNKVFGFTPRYSEYKVPRDFLTGDFRCRSVGAETLQAWHMMRLFDYTDYDEVVHDIDFVSATDAKQYGRIFYENTENGSDQIHCIFRFHVNLASHQKPLYDVFDFSNDDGHDVILDSNGVKVN